MQHQGATAHEASGSATNGRNVVLLLAAASSLVVLVANLSGIATGDDGVGYRAIADSILAGDGFGYFLEDPVTVWPPVWPALMAFVAWATPLDTVGAAIVLNAAVAFGVVLAGNRLLATFVRSDRLVLLGTLVVAFGPTTVGFGRLLMTDMAFALVTMVWMLALDRFWRRGALRELLIAGGLAWLGFGLRYVGLVLVAFGGLWLLLDSRLGVVDRVRNGMLYGIVAAIAPVAWMARNHAIDGTFTGERHSSARGLIDNGFDIAATLGRFLLPGVGYGLTKVWAAVGLVALAVALWLLWRVLRDRYGSDVLAASVRLLGHPVGLLVITGVLYLLYMLYVRTTTALNQLDVRLLYPAYFPLLVLGVVLADRLRTSDPDRWGRRAVAVVHVWAVANVIAGLVATTAFALGHPYFEGNYESDAFDRARRNPALETLPADCVVYSNLPNGLYPTVEALWSPMRTALESTDDPDPGFDLESITERAGATPTCLVWIDEPPVYGHLWPLDELEDRLDLTELGADGTVTVFRMEPRA